MENSAKALVFYHVAIHNAKWSETRLQNAYFSRISRPLACSVTVYNKSANKTDSLNFIMIPTCFETNALIRLLLCSAKAQ